MDLLSDVKRKYVSYPSAMADERSFKSCGNNQMETSKTIRF